MATEDLECLSLSPAAIQSKHQPVVRPRTQRLVVGHPTQLGDRFLIAAEIQQKINASIEDDQPLFVQRGPQCRCHRQFGEVGDRGATPQRRRLVECEKCGRRIGAAELFGVLDQLTGTKDIDLVRPDG